MAQINVTYAADTQELVRGTQAGLDALTDLAGGARALAPDLAAAGDASDGAAANLLKLGGSATNAAAGTVKLMDGLRSGNVVAAADAFSGLAGAIAGLSGPVGITVGVLGTLAGAVAYVVSQSIEAERTMSRLASTFALNGHGAEISRGFIDAQIQSLETLGGVSRKTAVEILGIEAAQSKLGAATLDQVNQLVPAFVAAYGEQAPEAVKKLLSGLGDLTEGGFRALDREMLDLSPAQYEVIQGFIRTGDAAAAVKTILGDMADAGKIKLSSLQERMKQLDEQIERTKADAQNWPFFDQATVAFDDEIARLQKARDGLAQAAEKAQRRTTDNGYKDELDAATALTAKDGERERIAEQIARFARDAADAQAHGRPADEAMFDAAEEKERQKLVDADRQAQEQQFRAWLATEEAKVEATRQGSTERIALLQEEAAKAKNDLGAQSTEYQQAQKRLAQEQQLAADQQAAAQQHLTETTRAADAQQQASSKAAAEKSAAEQIQVLEKVTQAARRGSQERIADAQKELEFARSLGKAGAEFQEAAQEHVTEAQKEAAAEQQAIRKNDATTEIELAKLKLTAARSELAAEVEASESVLDFV
jgi:phage-related minor tail protein